MELNKEKKKKICAITTIGVTLEDFVIPAMRLFVQDGYDVTLISTMDDSFIKKYSKEFHCINVTMKRGFSFRDLLTKPFEFYRIFKREKFDYVQYATNNAAWYASIGAWLARIPTRVNCLWGIGFITEKGLKRRFYKFVEKFPCIISTHVSIPSRKNQELGAEAGLYKFERSSVVGDGGTVGVNLNVFDYSKREDYRDAVLKEYPQLEGKCVFGYLGRIYKQKGIYELLEAFMDLNNENTYLFLIGGIDDSRGGVESEVLTRAKANSHIIFHGYTREVPKYLSIVDILVHPSYHEGFSMAIQQAMAMGCAIITTNVPGPSEVIEENKSGMLVPIMEVKPLVNAMQVLYDNPALKEGFVNEGIKRVRLLFSTERMARATYENRIDIMNGKYN